MPPTGSNSIHNLGILAGQRYPRVSDFASLPSAALHPSEIYVVESPTGLLVFLNLKRGGLYLSNGATWIRLGGLQEQFSTSNFVIYDSADNTKKVLYDLTNLTTGTTRTILMPDNDVDLFLLNQATELVRGTSRKATQPEADTGTDDLTYLTPLKAKNTRGTEGFFLAATGNFGGGGGWADQGFIQLVPALLFDSNMIERAIYMFYAISRGKLDQVNPIVELVVYSTTAPDLNDAVRWRLTCNYRAENESLTGPANETLFVTQELTTLTADTRQSNLTFTLNRTLIVNQDTIHLNLERIGSDGLDTYGGDVGIGQGGLIGQTIKHD